MAIHPLERNPPARGGIKVGEICVIYFEESDIYQFIFMIESMVLSQDGLMLFIS